MDDTVETPVLTLVGYERHGRFFWNLPVARFSIYPTLVTIQPTADWLGFVVPPWRAAIEDLGVVEAVRNGLWRGVRVRTKSDDYRIFYCKGDQPAAILDCLAALGVEVGRGPQKVYTLNPKL